MPPTSPPALAPSSARSAAGNRQASQTGSPLRTGDADRLREPLWPDRPQRSRGRPQAQPALAGSGRTPPVKDVGEPCAGEPHARFDGQGLETECDRVTAPAPDPTNLPGPVVQVCIGLLPRLGGGWLDDFMAL